MEELHYVYALAGVIVGYFLLQVVTRRFDPFAPIWLFLVGYVQVYVVQPISYHEWAVNVRGEELVTLATSRALWALIWMLAVYHSGIGKLLAAITPRPPARWKEGPVVALTPILFFWGLICAGMIMRRGDNPYEQASAESTLLRSFHCILLVSGILLIVTARSGPHPRPAVMALGLGIGALYILIWMFNGKRSHSLMGVICTTCAFYITKLRRPSWPVLLGVACTGAMAVGVAIGWRNDRVNERSLGGFVNFITNFDPENVLLSLNIDTGEEEGGAEGKFVTHETEEWGGYLIMLNSVPALSDYDYGSSYLRVVTTFIPRIIWPSKPLPGREQWVRAWIASSEMERDETFTGPAIGLLGAAQLNGGFWGTVIVMAAVAIMLSTAYAYFRRHERVPWVQAFWAVTFINSWFMVVTDDPMVWFYYNWGFTTMPFLAILWACNMGARPAAAADGGPPTWAGARHDFAEIH